MGPKLVTFGCSYTAGDGLPDRFKKNFRSASKYSYPSMLSQILKIPCDNQAKSGSGNLEILWNILHYDFSPKDIVLIRWSHFSRDCIIGPNEHQRIHDKNEKLTKFWLLTHTEYDQTVRNWFYIHHAGCYLKSLNLQYYHMIGGGLEDSQSLPEFLKIDNLLLDINFDELDKALDNSHPGIRSHRSLANKLSKIIKLD